MAAATEAWGEGGDPYASTSMGIGGDQGNPDDSVPLVFNPHTATERNVLLEIYHEVMNIKGNVAVLRTEFDDHVDEWRRRHTHLDREMSGAAAQITVLEGLVRNLPAPQPPAPQLPAPQPPAPQPPVPQPPLPPRPQPAAQGSPKLKMAKPKPFNGKNEEATTFQVNCNMYIQGTDPNATDDQKIGAIISYMEGTARDWLQIYLEADLTNRVAWLHNVDLFWQEFQGRFGDFDKEEKNRAKFNKLKQHGSIQDYLRDFQRLAVGLQYGDHALRDKFYEGLQDNIKSMMITQMFDPYGATETLQTVATRATMIYNKLEQLKPLTKAIPNVGKSSSVPVTATAAPSVPRAPRERLNVGDNVYMISQDGRAKKGKIIGEGKNSRGALTPTVKWSTGKSLSVPYPALKKDSRPVMTPSAPTKPDPKGPGLMELHCKGCPQVTCNICGGKGHFARVCPSRPMSGHAAEVGEEKPIEFESEDEESGKGEAKTQ